MAVEAIDQAKTEAFVGRLFGDTSAAMTTIMAAIGDRHGLFKALAAGGPATSAELAARAQRVRGAAVRGSAATDGLARPVEHFIEQAHRSLVRDPRLDPGVV